MKNDRHPRHDHRLNGERLSIVPIYGDKCGLILGTQKPYQRRHNPDRPPRFKISRTDRISIPLLTPLSMS